ncbi:MAG: efflux RND transporter periplasmic adaptor subunit [Parabacteroides sp.]
MRGKIIPLAMATALFVSCSQPAEKERTPRPVKLTQVASLNEVEKSFSGVVSADQFSDLAFKVSGPLIALRVEEGQRVRQGQVVAEIDPLDCQLEYEAKRSSYQTADAQLQRAKRLLEKQAISRQEFETTEASYSNAKAAFEYAKNQLEQTKLRAPFDGFIQKKYVENYQKVQAGQGIVCLINPGKLQVQFTMPEANMVYYNEPHNFFVEFDNYKGIRFQAKVKEYVEASPDGSGVPVFLYIDDPRFNLDSYKVAVGFSCRIILHINDHSKITDAVTVPLSAVVSSESSQERYVFVYDNQTQQVARRTIQGDGLLNKDEVIVTNGLQAGDRVVVAGATRLVDGQKVRVLTD